MVRAVPLLAASVVATALSLARSRAPVHVIAIAATIVPPAASSGTGGLFHGERASTTADPGAPLSIPDGLVTDERRADDRNETEGGEGGNVPRDREQPKQQDRRDWSTMAQAAADPQTQRDVRELQRGRVDEQQLLLDPNAERLTASEGMAAAAHLGRCGVDL